MNFEWPKALIGSVFEWLCLFWIPKNKIRQNIVLLKLRPSCLIKLKQFIFLLCFKHCLVLNLTTRSLDPPPLFPSLVLESLACEISYVSFALSTIILSFASKNVAINFARCFVLCPV